MNNPTHDDIERMISEDCAIEPEPDEAKQRILITSQGNEYLAAIQELQNKGWKVYHRWYLTGIGEAWWASLGSDYLLRCPSAADLVMIVNTIEASRLIVEEPAEFPDGEFPNYLDSMKKETPTGYQWTQADPDNRDYTPDQE